MHLRAVLRQSEGNTADFANGAAEGVDRRRSERRSLTLSAQTSSPSAGELPVLLLDISQGGLLLEAETTELSVEDQIELELPECGLVRASVAWKSGPFFGCKFSQPVAPAAISAALLKADPQVRDEVSIAPELPALRNRLAIGPEFNFSVAFLLALLVWGLIGLAYLAVRYLL
jgi:hypothetical protein